MKNEYLDSRRELVKYIDKSVNSIIDVGAGSGQFIKMLLDVQEFNIGKIYAVEPSCHHQKIKNINSKITVINDVYPNDQLSEIKVDYIFFNDVLEHMNDPWKVLSGAKKNLKENGRIICSIPNISNISIIFGLLKNNFEYKNYGILDKTHLRFFTSKTLRNLFDGSGYQIEKIEGINLSLPFRFKLRFFYRLFKFEKIPVLKYLLPTQYIILAKKV